MISFEEYCEIYDKLPNGSLGYNQESKTQAVEQRTGDRLFFCALVNDIQEDEAYFEAIINQSDLETLNKLLPFFSEGSKMERLLMDRIRLLQNYGAKIPKKKAENNKENNFFQYLCSWIDRKGFKSDSDFYNHAGISRQSFSKMRNNRLPISREMALHMAVALGLNYDEAVEFLKHAGYSFNPSSRREQIISFFMRKRDYTFYEIEEVLSVLHEKTFLDWN